VQYKAVSRHTKLFFVLIRELLPVYFDSQNLVVHKIFDSTMLLKNVIGRLQTYEPTEKRNSFLEDYTLVGIIDMITILI
jgi:hypothetical protein